MPPFKSAKQRRFLFAKHPEIAKKFAKDKPKSKVLISKVKKKLKRRPKKSA